jgi:hypothetical protein
MTAFLEKIDKQVQRAAGLLRDGDRAPYYLRGSGTFFSDQNTPVQIAFSAPADGDFFGDGLNVFIEVRSVFATGTQKSFCPADWTSVNDIFTSAIALGTGNIGAVSGDFDLFLPEPYANAATSIGAVFSSRHGYGILGGLQSYSVFPSKMEFFTPLFVPRGTTATMVFTPSYSKKPTGGTALEFEYRVNVVLEGFKKVQTIYEVLS